MEIWCYCSTQLNLPAFISQLQRKLIFSSSQIKMQMANIKVWANPSDMWISISTTIPIITINHQQWQWWPPSSWSMNGVAGSRRHGVWRVPLLATTRLYSAMVFWYWHWYFLLEYQVVLVHLLACSYSPLCTEILLVLHWYLYRQCYWNIYWY